MLKVLHGDCREVIKTLPDESIHCVVTSPPFYGLRNYGTSKWVGGDENCDHIETTSLRRDSPGGFHNSTGRGNQPNSKAVEMQFRDICGKCGAVREDSQIGLENSPWDYIDTLVGLFREIWRVLRTDGTVWLNLGDSYYNYRPGAEAFKKQSFASNRQDLPMVSSKRGTKLAGFKEKDLMGMPWRVALALCDDGWYLRSDIVWNKPNPLPESVKDRPTKSHEYIFLLTKSPKYYYDMEAIREPVLPVSLERVKHSLHHRHPDDVGIGMPPVDADVMGDRFANPSGRNKRSVWTINTESYQGSHFATFPQKLVEPCILAGSPTKVCTQCGTGWNRITEPVREHGLAEIAFPKTQDLESHNGHKRLHQRLKAARDAGEPHDDALGGTITVGWMPGCLCNKQGYKLKSDDFEVMESLPLYDLGNTRMITRFEQRAYAKQLQGLYDRKETDIINALKQRLPMLEDYQFIDAKRAVAIPPDVIDEAIINGWFLKEELPIPFGTKEAVVLDPFLGSGTTAKIALKFGRGCIGIELNPAYIGLIEERTDKVQKVFDMS